MDTAAARRLEISAPVEAARSASVYPAYSAAEHRTLLKISVSGLCCGRLLFYSEREEGCRIYIFPLSARLFRDNALACRTFISYPASGSVSSSSFLSTFQLQARHLLRSRQDVRCTDRNRSRNQAGNTCRPGSP